MFGIRAERRSSTEIAAGDAVDVALKLDTARREVAMPPDFADVLDGAADALRFFNGLSYSRTRSRSP